MQKYLKYIIPIGLVFALVMSIVGPYNSLTQNKKM